MREEYELEVLEKYDIEVKSTRRIRGAFFCIGSELKSGRAGDFGDCLQSRSVPFGAAGDAVRGGDCGAAAGGPRGACYSIGAAGAAQNAVLHPVSGGAGQCRLLCHVEYRHQPAGGGACQ